MCLLAVFFRAVPNAPVILGANREEFYDRQGLAPHIQGETVRFLGGKDPVAGGTWLGINAHGVVVGVTNRRKSQLPNPARSRGLLAKDLLASSTAVKAAQLAQEELSRRLYSGCNILCVDAHDCIVLHAGDWLRVRPLPPGLHVLTASDVDSENDPRINYAFDWLSARPQQSITRWIRALQELCGYTGIPPICLKGQSGGTISSSVIALGSQRNESRFVHAQGSPDVTPYEDYSRQLLEVLGSS